MRVKITYKNKDGIEEVYETFEAVSITYTKKEVQVYTVPKGKRKWSIDFREKYKNIIDVEGKFPVDKLLIK